MAVKDASGALAALKDAQVALREASSNLDRVTASLASEREDRQALAMAELAERFGVSGEALVAFVETAGGLLGGKELSVADARRAGMIAAARAAWENELGPLLSTAQVREMLGGVSRQSVDERLQARRLIGMLDSSRRRQFPLFQFHDGRVLETLIAAYWMVADGGLDEWSAASWCVAPDPALEGRSPLMWSRDEKDADRLLQIARQDAARFAR